MNSLRVRLFITLTLVTVVVWSAAAVWVNVRTRGEVERVLDRRLVEAARMVGSLAAHNATALSSPVASRIASQATSSPYDRQLSCQIWSFDGRLIGRSAGAPVQPLAASRAGFSERVVGDKTWRVYTYVDPARGFRVQVGDNLDVRQALVADMILGLLLPALVGVVALAALIWGAIGRGLRPLRQMAATLTRRDVSDLTPLRFHSVASELQPIAASLENLLARLASVRAGERHLIASAAHELQTPLAGMRMHAQIALAADDDDVRVRALGQIVTSVDRTSRLVRQLLDLARQEARAETPQPRWIAVEPLLRSILSQLEPQIQRTQTKISISDDLAATEVLLDEESFILAARNLIENAVQYSPAASEVCCGVSVDGNHASIFVDDAGPGIPPDEIEGVRGRFVRGRTSRGVGSGLGLSIAEFALERVGGRLALRNRRGGGLRAAIVLDAKRIRRLSMSPVAEPDEAELGTPETARRHG